MEIYVYGTGCIAGDLIDNFLPLEKIQAFVESEPTISTFMGKSVIPASKLCCLDYDLIIVASRQSEAIYDYCIKIGLDLSKLFFTKNNMRLNDMNQSRDIAERLLGRDFVDSFNNTQRLINAPMCSEKELLPEKDLNNDYVRLKTLELIADRIKNVPGAVAELGVYKGSFAKCINTLLPDRMLYLFDSFSGFNEAEAKSHDIGDGFKQSHKNTAIEQVRSVLPHPEKAVFMPGLFPNSLNGLEDSFALVSLDVDLEESTLAGLRYFYPRMNTGGYILLHDYNSPKLPGVKAAVERFETELGHRILSVPLCDVNGTLVIPI